MERTDIRATVIIAKRGEGYISTVSLGLGHIKASAAASTPYEAAASAARLMVEYYAQGNLEGGELMAPPEVLEIVLDHLRSIAAPPLEELTKDWRARASLDYNPYVVATYLACADELERLLLKLQRGESS